MAASHYRKRFSSSSIQEASGIALSGGIVYDQATSITFDHFFYRIFFAF